MRKTAGRRTAAATCSIAANIDALRRGTPGCRLRARLRARLACALAGAFRRQRSASPRRAAAPAGRGEPEGARRSPWQARVLDRRAQRAARSRRAAGGVACRDRPHSRADRGPRQPDRDRRPAAKRPVCRHRHALEEARAGARAAGCCERRQAASGLQRGRRGYPREAKAYQAALDQFKLGNYPMAVSAMQGFLVTYPGSSLAPNAQYWIGMAYSGQRDYKSAIAAQRKLLAAWPDSPKAPDAMLSIASAQETMGDRRAAQKTLEELIARYPSSSAATSAKQRLSAYPKR